ncbi:MAG: transporter substrate-binding domain-containing protein [Alphaproteobacteria bacterium]|nr:transporter substrate-binding domain-containing protein [Alphaproteobacteria bacterium]
MQFPHFRHVDKAAIPPQAQLPQNLTLLADEDFAPFSFKGLDGRPVGISVQLGLAACVELKIQCTVKTVAYGALLQALEQKQGDVVLGGPQASDKAAGTIQSTRPYYYSYSQFVVRNGGNFSGVEAKALAGRRLGYVKATAQELFLKKYYDRATLIPFTTEEAMFEALRTGGLDLAFADSLHVAFWIKGNAARGCCAPYGAPFADKGGFTHALVMMTRKEDGPLRQALDLALDRLQEKGVTAKILSTYLPSSPF